MAGWIESPEARRQFVRKLEFLAGRYRDDPTIYGWELWNEMNAVVGPGDYLGWTSAMLPELHRLFPHQLCMQSLGSYDSERSDRVVPQARTHAGQRRGAGPSLP